MGRWRRAQQKEWRKQFFEVPHTETGERTRRRHVRGSLSWHEVAAMAHPRFFEGQVPVDTRVVCPQDVKKMLLKKVRMVYW